MIVLLLKWLAIDFDYRHERDARARGDVSGDSIFVSAAAATQFLINVCGLSNVPRILNKDEEKYYLLYADYTFNNRMCTEKI
jgi:hypothetical protein